MLVMFLLLFQTSQNAFNSVNMFHFQTINQPYPVTYKAVTAGQLITHLNCKPGAPP